MIIKLILFRSSIQAIVYLIVGIAWKDSFIPAEGEFFPLICRCVFGAISFCSGYTAVGMLPLADASTIIFSAPAYVGIFACVLLKEPCGISQLFVIILALSGVVLISKPTFIFGGTYDKHIHNRLLGVGMAFISSVTFALAFVSIRRIKNTTSAVIIFWLSFVCIALGSVILLATNGFSLPQSTDQYLLILGNGCCGVLAQFTLTVALKVENAGPVSLARTIDIVMAFIYQTTVLGEAFNWLSLGGAVLVISCVAFLAFEKYKEQNPEVCSKWFCFQTPLDAQDHQSQSEHQN